MVVGQLIDAIQESEYLTVVFQETDNRLVEACYFFVGLVATGIVSAATVEDVASAVAALVGGNAFAIGETEDAHHQRPLAVILGECGWSVFRMGRIGIVLGGLETVCPADDRIFCRSKLRQLGEPLKYIQQIGIRENGLMVGR